MAEALSAEQKQDLLCGIDAAFEAVLHGRYGGGLSAAFAGDPGQLILRPGGQDFLHFCLQSRDTTSGPAIQGVAIGVAWLTSVPEKGVESTDVQTEIFLDQDVNEASDATALSTGVLLQRAPDRLPNGGLLVVRSTEAARNNQQIVVAQQQNWRPNQSRHVAASGPGASGRSYRQSSPACLFIPVSADLLSRIGGAVAALSMDITHVAVSLLSGVGS